MLGHSYFYIFEMVARANACNEFSGANLAFFCDKIFLRIEAPCKVCYVNLLKIDIFTNKTSLKNTKNYFRCSLV